MITHYNYSEFLGEALRSVQTQTHQEFECVVVDDASDARQRAAAKAKVAALGDPRFRFVQLKKNGGQIKAVFEGLNATTAPFVALLDPDDVYEPELLASMLRAHLNPHTRAALVSCEMGVFSSAGVLGLETVGFRRKASVETRKKADEDLKTLGFSKFYPSWEPGWHWAATSGMMFRRDALEMIRPYSIPKGVKFNGDSYCGHGAHMVGGTLYIDRLLSWRRVHDKNTARVTHHFSSTQNRVKSSFVDYTRPLKLWAIDTALLRGVEKYFSVSALFELLNAHFSEEALTELAQRNLVVREILLRMVANHEW